MAVLVTPARLRRDLQRLVADTQSATLAISITPVVSARLAPWREQIVSCPHLRTCKNDAGERTIVVRASRRETRHEMTYQLSEQARETALRAARTMFPHEKLPD